MLSSPVVSLAWNITLCAPCVGAIVVFQFVRLVLYRVTLAAPSSEYHAFDAFSFRVMFSVIGFE